MSKAKATSRFRLLQGQDATNAKAAGEWCRTVEEQSRCFLASRTWSHHTDHVHDKSSPSEDLIYDKPGTSYDSNTSFWRSDMEDNEESCCSKEMYLLCKMMHWMSILDDAMEQGVQSRLAIRQTW
ncbi:hypothetical protein Tco_0385397 [Tanacetum coccineum]